jgi:cell division protein FtsA
MTEHRVSILDLGTTKAVCMAARSNDKGDIVVEGLAVVPCSAVQKGAVVDAEAAATAIDDAAAQVERMIGGPVDSLTVLVSGPHLASVNSQGFAPIYPNTRAVRRDDVLQVIGHSRQVVMPADREQIMAVPREFRIDGQRGVSRPIGMTGGRLEVVTHIVTGQSAVLQTLDRAVTMAGRQVEQMVVGPLASGLGVATTKEAEQGCLVVDIGGNSTDVAWLDGGSVAFLASLQVGSAHATRDVAALVKTTEAEAERLKLESGAAIARLVGAAEAVTVTQLGSSEARPMQRRVLCEIIESRMREVASLVRRQIEQSGARALPPAIVVTGGGSQLPGVAELFAEALGGGTARTASPTVSGPQRRLAETPGMAAAVGAARFCLEGDELEFAPVAGFSNWKDKIRTLRSLLGGKG